MSLEGNGASTPSQYGIPKGARCIRDLGKYRKMKEDQYFIFMYVWADAGHLAGKDQVWPMEQPIDLQDIIEDVGMDFARGNIFKAIYRLGEKNDNLYEYRKVLWFARRIFNQGEYGYQQVIDAVETLISNEESK